MSEKKLTSSTLDCILAHRSIRQFTHEPVSDKVIEQLVNAARFASTSNTFAMCFYCAYYRSGYS